MCQLGRPHPGAQNAQECTKADGITQAVVDIESDVIAQGVESLGLLYRLANTNGVAFEDVVDQCGDQRVLRAEVMAGQGAAIAGSFTRCL